MEAAHMLRHRVMIPFVILGLTLASGMAARARTADRAVAEATAAARVARGEYLVRFGSCHDCHTPHKLGPKGPEPDMSRALSGHPADLTLPPPAAQKEPWVLIGAATNTAFAGPWGISFTANLTSDKETGLGNWTEEMFLKALRTGRHEGKGRPILPPMPYQYVGSLTDDDLKAVFSYLQSLPPIRNRVPSPVDPPEEGGR
jgi:cytochrome c553